MRIKQKHTLKQFVWELTLKCNLQCIHCGSSAGNARPDEISTKDSIKLIKDLSKINTEEICFMGGEPFLRKEWELLAKTVKNHDINLSIISNGYLINNSIISKLKKLDPYAVATSLDGATEKTHDQIRGVKGSYKKVMNFISLLKKSDLPTTVITTINKLNISELPTLAELLIDKEIAWQIQIAAPEGRFSKKYTLSKKEFYSVGLFISSLIQKYDRKKLPVIGAHCLGYHSNYLPSLGLYKNWIGCQAGISTMSIKSNGDVIGCLSLPKQYIEGNIREKNIIDIWNDSNSFSYNRNFKLNDLGNNCQDCKFSKTCRGGCMGMSTSITKSPHNDSYCFYKFENELFKNQSKGVV